jgi:hypothetical protein
VHFLLEELDKHKPSACPLNIEAPVEYKKAIEVDGTFKKIPLDPRVPDRVVCIGTEASQEE